ncbi:MAG: peptidoglycan DD-metalloendopeptidase family protein, partial [Candidatus Promineifilaceae bacterium]|nr:peptidoglycan DD-metalloendopeptidase family protein [Candidatus Promineifilaceae bacterium]
KLWEIDLIQWNSFLVKIAAGALLWLLSGCVAVSQPVPDQSMAQAVLVESPEPTAFASFTPAPTRAAAVASDTLQVGQQEEQATKVPPAAITPVPTDTPVPSATPKPSPTTKPQRLCPDEAPLKPEYNRYFLAPQEWPTADPSIADSHFWLSKPLPGEGRTLINQRFPYGWDENGRLLLHNGVDIAEDLGMEVLAAGDGTVIVSRSDLDAWYGWRCDWYGHLVVIELDQRWQDQPIYVLYGHVLNLKVEEGDRVSRGQPVAEIGFGGAATNPHLHLEVRVGENEFDATRNPMLWINPGPTRGVIAGRLVDPEGRPWQGVPLALVGRDGTNGKASTWSYLGDPQHLANPDEGWAENFVFADIGPGDYDIYTSIQGTDYRYPVTVFAGEVTVVEIETEPLKTATPVPSETAVPNEDTTVN